MKANFLLLRALWLRIPPWEAAEEGSISQQTRTCRLACYLSPLRSGAGGCALSNSRSQCTGLTARSSASSVCLVSTRAFEHGLNSPIPLLPALRHCRTLRRCPLCGVAAATRAKNDSLSEGDQGLNFALLRAASPQARRRLF